MLYAHLGPFYKIGLTLSLTWISNHMPIKKVAGNYLLIPKLQGCNRWISNIIPNIIKGVVIYVHVSKIGLCLVTWEGWQGTSMAAG